MKPLKILSIVVGTLSIVTIVRHAFEVSFVAALQLILDYYDLLIGLLFGWAEPYILALFAWLSNFVGWDIQLYPQWQHIFVLLWLYFGTHTRMAWSVGHKSAAVFDVVWGGVVAFAAVAFSGLEAVPGIMTSMLLPISAVLGVVIFGLGTSVRAATFFRNEGEPWWNAFREFVRHSVRFAVGGGVVIAVGAVGGSQLTNFEMPELGMLVLLFLVILLALYRIIMGPRWGRYEPDKSGRWWQRTRRSVEAKIGFYMLGAIGAAVLFVLANAGLKLLGA